METPCGGIRACLVTWHNLSIPRPSTASSRPAGARGSAIHRLQGVGVGSSRGRESAAVGGHQTTRSVPVRVGVGADQVTLFSGDKTGRLPQGNGSWGDASTALERPPPSSERPRPRHWYPCRQQDSQDVRTQSRPQAGGGEAALVHQLPVPPCHGHCHRRFRWPALPHLDIPHIPAVPSCWHAGALSACQGQMPGVPGPGVRGGCAYPGPPCWRPGMFYLLLACPVVASHPCPTPLLPFPSPSLLQSCLSRSLRTRLSRTRWTPRRCQRTRGRQGPARSEAEAQLGEPRGHRGREEVAQWQHCPALMVATQRILQGVKVHFDNDTHLQ